MTLHTCFEPLLTSDCTVILHITNCFAVPKTPIAKAIQQRYPHAQRADKQYKLPPRERLGRFSFALSDDKEKLIFHLYGRFRTEEAGGTIDVPATKQAFRTAFQAIALAESKGFPVKIGTPHPLVHGQDQEQIDTLLSLYDELSETFGYEVYLYTL